MCVYIYTYMQDMGDIYFCIPVNTPTHRVRHILLRWRCSWRQLREYISVFTPHPSLLQPQPPHGAAHICVPLTA